MKIGSWLRTRFAAGLLVTVPVIITVLVVRLLYLNLNGLLGPWLDRWLGRHVPGLGLAATLLLVLLVGLFAANFAGKRLIALAEGVLARLPLVRAVYRASQEIVAAVALPRGKGLREPVMIEYPRPGVWSYGFVTAYTERAHGEVRDPLANVYLPSPPMPTSGMLVAVPVADLRYLDLSVEQAMKLIVSGGMVTPAQLAVRAAEPGAGPGASAPAADRGP